MNDTKQEIRERVWQASTMCGCSMKSILIETHTHLPRPKGIYWDCLTNEGINILEELHRVCAKLPSSAEEGWPRHQEKYSEASSYGADGVVLVNALKKSHSWSTPLLRLRAIALALRARLRGLRSLCFFLLRASTPPQLRRGAFARLLLDSSSMLMP